MSNYKSIIKKNFLSISGVLILNIIASLAMVFAGYSLSFLVTAYEYEGDKIKALTITFLIELIIWIKCICLDSETVIYPMQNLKKQLF